MLITIEYSFGQRTLPNFIIILEDVISDKLKNSYRSAVVKGDYVIYVHKQYIGLFDSAMHGVVSGICCAPLTPNKLVNGFKKITHGTTENVQNKCVVEPQNTANTSNRKCVLLVEDNIINQQVAQHMLEKRQYGCY